MFDINKIKEISNAIKRNDDGSLTITSTSADSSVATKMALKDLADLEIGKTYIISFITTGKKQIYLNEVKQYWMSDSVLTITQDMLNSNVRLYPKDVSSTDIVSGIQIEEASTATDFQPYQSQPFNYTLSKPLYRLSDSVYDYIDVDKGKIVRNIGMLTFDGSVDEWLFTHVENYYNDTSTAVLTSSLGFTSNMIYGDIITILCDKLTAFSVNKNIWMKSTAIV